METELLPVVDLGVLSHSDLDALAAASAHAVAPRSYPDAADPLPPLKIDRAVFNESAGSRKQTFSRRRLATATSSTHPISSSAKPPSAVNVSENNLIAYHLRRLFAREDPPLPTPPDGSQPQTLALREPSPSPPPSPPPDPDRETTNSKGVSVDLVRLAGMAHPYEGELRGRTGAMASESELMGFISSLAGQWVSQRKRRKFVDAAFFGSHLPNGWRLQLGLKRKDGMAWVHCFSYVSPKGQQFATCKEVSAYLMSLLGYPEAKAGTTQYDSTGQPDSCTDNGVNVVGFQNQTGSNMDYQSVPVTSVTFSSFSNDSNDQDGRNIDATISYKCQKCNLIFCDQSAYMHHELVFHNVSAKRRKFGKFGEPMVGKDGKFECPVCHKTFEERSRYFGHVGSHARYQGLTPETFLDTTSGKVVNNSLAELSFRFQEVHGSPQQKERLSAGEPESQHHNFTTKHGGNSTSGIELSSTSCSDYFYRPNEAWQRPENAPNTLSAPNDQLDGSINFFAGATDFNGQAGSHQVFSPTTFGTANHYQHQTIDRVMSTSKHVEVNNTMKVRDVNLNSSLDTISFPIGSAKDETSTVLNGANRSSVTGKGFSGNFDNKDDGAYIMSSSSGLNNKIPSSLGAANRSSIASRSFNASYGNDSGASNANNFANRSNTMVYQSNLSMPPVSSVVTNVDCFSSHPVHFKNTDKDHAYNTAERVDTTQNRTSNEAGFDVAAYNNGIFNRDNTERNLVGLNSSRHIRPNMGSHSLLSESNTLATKGSDVNWKASCVSRSDANCINGSFVNKPINNNESNGPMLEVMGKSGSDTQNHYNGRSPSCDMFTPTSSQNVNGQMQGNFGNMPSRVRSVGDIPIGSTTRDQCDLQLGFSGQKQQVFPGYGEFRSTAVGPPQLGNMTRNSSLPTRSPQFESSVRTDPSPTGSSTKSPQFGGVVRTDPLPTGSSTRSPQFGSVVRTDPLPTGSSQVGSLPKPNFMPNGSSQVGSMGRPNFMPTGSSQVGSLAKPNSVATGFSQFASMPKPNSVPAAESSQFGSMARQNFASTSEAAQVLGYAPQMANGPPVQLGWDLSLSRMVSGGMITAVCVWCNSQFHHFGTVDGQQASSFSFICPSCKDRVSGHRNIPNNGPWQP